MSMLSDFYEFLLGLFQEGEALDHEEVKQRLQDGGYEGVTAYDVKEAVSLMYDEGDVFNSQQASALVAYTGANMVDQSFNAGDIGAINSSIATSGGATNHGGHGHQPPADAYVPPAEDAYAPPAYPPPPPMDPATGQTALDGAVQQIVYVNSVTNNNTTNTTLNDNDTFEDNDTIVDASVNQTIFAAGDVTQDFDTTTVGGDVDGVLTGDHADLEGAAVGDGNQVFNDSDGNVIGNDNTTLNDSNGNAVGDHATAVNIAGHAGPVAVGGDAIDASYGGAVAQGDGDAVVAPFGQVNTGEGDNVVAVNSQVTGEGDNIAAAAGGFVNTGEGDQLVNAGHGDINNTDYGDIENIDAVNSNASTGGDAVGNAGSLVGASAFGEGAAEQTNVIGNHVEDGALTAGDEADAFVAIDESIDQVAVVDSNLLGSGVTTDGDVEGNFEIATVDIEVPDPEPESVEDAMVAEG